MSIQRKTVCVAMSGFVVLTGLALQAPAEEAAKFDVLRVGTSTPLAGSIKAGQEATARRTLQLFIKSETGFNSEIVTLKDYQELADHLVKGDVQLGMFQGYEFAWARATHPKLQPLALAVNVHANRNAFLVVRKDNKAANFAALQGTTLNLPNTPEGHVRLFVERQAQANGKDLMSFFSKVATPDNTEDALDDVVDGTVQAAAADQVSLEAYKERKPGRFARLRDLVRSPVFPAPVVSYQQGKLDEATLKRFSTGLLKAKEKEQGQMLLTLFKLTSFEPIAKDYDKVLDASLKAYPPPEKVAK